jgi:hypothetical protein
MLSIADGVEPLENLAGSRAQPFRETHILEWYGQRSGVCQALDLRDRFARRTGSQLV